MPTNNYPGIGYKTQGLDFNYWSGALSISATTFGGGSVDGYQPDIIITCPTPTRSVIFNIQGAASGTSGKVVEYSFNGQTVHGTLDSNTNNGRSSLYFEDRVITLVWFRIQSGSTGPLTVTVEAWSGR